MYLSIDKVRQHLNLDDFYHEDDDYIIHLISAAEDATAKRLNVKSLGCLINEETGYLPESVNHSVLLLIGTWYANREVISNGTINHVPLSYEFLAGLNKNYISPF